MMETAAPICEGCSYNFAGLNLLAKDQDRLYQFLMVHGLIPISIKCPSCGNDLYPRNGQFSCSRTIGKQSKKAKRVRCTVRQSALRGTIFYNVKVPMKDIIFLINWFLIPNIPRNQIYFESKLGAGTVAEWFCVCRRVCMNYCIENSQKLGGPGKIVEVREAKLAKRVNTRCVEVENHHIVCGYERNSRKVFLVIVQDVEENILMCISNWVEKGSTIITNRWIPLKDLRELGYEPKRPAVVTTEPGPRSCITADCVLWDQVHLFGDAGKQLDGHLATMLFRKAVPIEQRYHFFLLSAALLHPPC